MTPTSSPTSAPSGRAGLARRLLDPAPMRFLALLLLCSAYLQGGINKALDFPGAVAEMTHFGLTPAVPFAAATSAFEIVAALMILTGIYRWAGALGLAGFTFLANVMANRFWDMAPPERLFAANGFFEHLGLVGAFVLVAWYDLARRD